MKTSLGTNAICVGALSAQGSVSKAQKLQQGRRADSYSNHLPVLGWKKKCYPFISSICQVLWQNRSSSYPNKKVRSIYLLYFEEVKCHSTRAACKRTSAQWGKKSWPGTELLRLSPQALAPTAPPADTNHPVRCWYWLLFEVICEMQSGLDIRVFFVCCLDFSWIVYEGILAYFSFFCCWEGRYYHLYFLGSVNIRDDGSRRYWTRHDRNQGGKEFLEEKQLFPT